MITGILLAAGAGRRFGPDTQKLLATLPDGRCVIEAAAANLRAACGHVIAVARRDSQLLETLRAAGCEVVINERADEGMGTSIAAGVAASAEAGGWLIALGDMPAIQPATIRAILGERPAEDVIVMPAFNGRRGHPVRFARCHGAALGALEGDRGARSVVERYAQHLVILETTDPGVLADIDTPADLGRA